MQSEHDSASGSETEFENPEELRGIIKKLYKRVSHLENEKATNVPIPANRVAITKVSSREAFDKFIENLNKSEDLQKKWYESRQKNVIQIIIIPRYIILFLRFI